MENGTTAARLIERRRRHLFGAHAAHVAQLGRFKLALVSGAITLLCAAVAWGATEAPRGSVVLWSGDDQWVKIEPQDDPAAAPNDHPVQLGRKRSPMRSRRCKSASRIRTQAPNRIGPYSRRVSLQISLRT